MTLRLRKIHRLIWLVWAALLPLGWLAAIWSIPGAVWQDPVRLGRPEPLGSVTHSAVAGEFILHLRQDSAGLRRQLEVFVQRPLVNGGVTAWQLGNPDVALGLIGARGVWRFDLDSLQGLPRIRLEDNIKRRVLHTVAFR